MSNPLTIPELVSLVISYVDGPADLLRCSCVNSIWSTPALQKLYRGSMHDMRLRTPDIGSLNSLFVASPERFARNAGFIKHLTIMSDMIPMEHERPVCLEKCRLFLDPKRAELLLRPRGKGPTSLAVPFELVDHDLSPLRGLILHPDLEFLTIDNEYCDQLIPSRRSRGEHIHLPMCPNLVGLSIYWSNHYSRIGGFCDWLDRHNLKILHMDKDDWPKLTWQHDTRKFLQTLWRHKDLQALALRINCDEVDMGEICAELEEQTRTACWPRLRALYLRDLGPYWLEKLDSFKELQILELRDVCQGPDFIDDLASSISFCRHLKVIHLEFDELYDSGILITMTRGCRHLERFCVKARRVCPRMSNLGFLQLVQALPHVEFLVLSVICKMTASTLRDLADHCPRLEVLEMNHSRLHLSLASLTKVPSLSKLKLLRLRALGFKDPNDYAQLTSLQSIATEWSRVFPQIRRSTCDADICDPGVHLKGHPSNCESYEKDDDSIMDDDNEMSSDADDDTNTTANDEEMSSDGDDDDFMTDNSEMASDSDDPVAIPGLNDDWGSKWHRLRMRLWKLLGYNIHGSLDDASLRRHHMWQNNFEIEILGWPIVSRNMHLNPDVYSFNAEDE